MAAARAVNPDARPSFRASSGSAPWRGSAQTRSRGASTGPPHALTRSTREQAARETPGVAEVRSSFAVIFLLFALVVPLVSGLFFLIITLQKARALTLLRAIGAPAGSLVRSLLIQVLIVVGGGILVGTALFVPLSQATVGSLSLRFDPVAVLVWSALLLGLGLVSAIAAARRVLGIDPVEATTGGGAR